jgi:hypothetical protein
MTILVSQWDNGRGGATAVLAAEAALGPAESQPPARAVRVHLEKLATGCWSVQAAAGTRGGLFRDHASATKFIRREFAFRQHTVIDSTHAQR